MIIEIYSAPDNQDLSIEDGGKARILECDDGVEENRVFVRIQSWDESGEHPELRQLVGKRLRITIETVDE